MKNKIQISLVSDMDPLDPKTWRFIKGKDGSNVVWKFWYDQRPDDVTLMLLKYQRDVLNAPDQRLSRTSTAA